VRTFDDLGFDHVYKCEFDPEFPGSGEWTCPVYVFTEEGVERVGVGGGRFAIRVGFHEVEWVGFFERGSGGITGVFGTPSPDQLLAVDAGAAFLVDVHDPMSAGFMGYHVIGVERVEGLPLLLLNDELSLTGIGPAGAEWTTPRLVMDGLTVLSARAEGIVCRGDHYGGEPPAVTLDPRTGSIIEGRAFEWDIVPEVPLAPGRRGWFARKKRT